MNQRKLSAKLTADDVREIKSLTWNGQSQTEIAKVFGVTQSNINRIVHGFTWPEVPWPDGGLGGLNIDEHIERLETLGIRKKRGTLIPRGVVRLPTPLEVEKTPKPLTPEQKEMAANITEERGQQAEADMELDIAKSIKASGKVARKGGKRALPKELKAKALPWKQVQAQAPRNPMVMLALENKDLRKCICIAFRALPTEMWNTPKAEEVVKQVGVNLGIEIKGNFFKIKE